MVNGSNMDPMAKQALYRLIGTSERQVLKTYDVNLTSRALGTLCSSVVKQLMAERQGKPGDMGDVLAEDEMPEEAPAAEAMERRTLETPGKRAAIEVQGAGASAKKRLSMLDLVGGKRALSPPVRALRWDDGEEEVEEEAEEEED